MLVVVEKVNKALGGRYNDSFNQKIIVKCIDSESELNGKSVSLNINPNDLSVYNRWSEYIKVGYILDVSLIIFNGVWYVDKFKGCKLVRKVQ